MLLTLYHMLQLVNAGHELSGAGKSRSIGGEGYRGFAVAKEQLLRPLGDAAQDPRLAALESDILESANALGIGPMGLGGAPTLLGVKLAARARLPASYFVTVAYMYWACRRRSIEL